MLYSFKYFIICLVSLRKMKHVKHGLAKIENKLLIYNLFNLNVISL